MNNKPPIKILYERISELKSSVAVSTSIKVFIISTIIVAALSFKYYNVEFAENVLVEAHGMLFDILVIGIFILSLNRLAEKRIENQRSLDEIDDFRGWKSKEAAYRIAGNIRRLNRNGFKDKINLRECYMRTVDLRMAYSRQADLKGIKTFLLIQQLAEVKSLYKAELDLDLMEQVREKYPHLLEKPK